MPRLRRYVRGPGFYISGHIPGVGHATWQIQDDGLEYLASAGIWKEGDRIAAHDLRYLLHRNLIWTNKQGPGAESSLPLDPTLNQLLPALEAWAACSGIERLSDAACIDGNSYVDRCFSRKFLEWLKEIAPDGSLAELSGLSEGAFADYGGRRYDKLSGDPLFGMLVARGAFLVPWRLASIVGLVARQLKVSPALPVAWEGKQVLEVVARAVRNDGTTLTPRGAFPASRRPPYVVWQLDLQRVIAILPAQRLETISEPNCCWLRN